MFSIKMTKLLSNLIYFLFILICVLSYTQGAIRRCYSCRSRGELGSCKDPFTYNETINIDEKGVKTTPCASGWCGKIIESDTTFKEEYGTPTQRICMQRGPSDNEERCATTVWNHQKVYMCFCQGDLCNSASRHSSSILDLIIIATTVHLIGFGSGIR